MNEQPLLPGFEPAPPATDSLFFAVMPEPQAIAPIEALLPGLRKRHGLRGRAAEPARMHVTLHHLGNHAGLPQPLVRQAAEMAQAVAEAAPPFTITFDRVESFFKPRNSPLVLRGSDGPGGLAGVIAFRQRLAEAMQGAGLGAWVQPRFAPHLTLMYDDRRLPPEAIEPIGWTVREFVLVHSLLGRHRYVVLHRWRLADGPLQ